jgi:hypothetical protein
LKIFLDTLQFQLSDKILMWVTYVKVVAIDVLHPLQLTAKIIVTASGDGTERWLFCTDLVPKITSMATPAYIYVLITSMVTPAYIYVLKLHT